MAGDSALLAMSTSRRMPKPTSCTMVRSNPIWTASATGSRSESALGGGWLADRRQAQAIGVPATTWSPTCLASTITRSWRTAALTSGSAATAWT
jgi:hypothetical protein